MVPTAADPFAGTPYRGLARIGRGGMGEVWEVAPAVGRPGATRMAAKLLTTEVSCESLDRFKLEVKIAGRLRGPHVVSAMDAGVTPGGRAYYVMECLSGETLRERLARRGPLPVTEAVELVTQALRGLAEAHALGVVHRDLKLDNLFVVPGRRGRPLVKVLDFGVAKVVGGHARTPTAPMVPTATGVLLGTPRFAAPEQILGEPVEPRTDLYAMGLVLHHLLVGHGPFDDARGLVELARAQVERQVPPPSLERPEVPRGLDAIVLRALSTRPEGRPPTAESFIDALGRVASGWRAIVPGSRALVRKLLLWLRGA